MVITTLQFLDLSLPYNPGFPGRSVLPELGICKFTTQPPPPSRPPIRTAQPPGRSKRHRDAKTDGTDDSRLIQWCTIGGAMNHWLARGNSHPSQPLLGRPRVPLSPFFLPSPNLDSRVRVQGKGYRGTKRVQNNHIIKVKRDPNLMKIHRICSKNRCFCRMADCAICLASAMCSCVQPSIYVLFLQQTCKVSK